MAVTKDARNNRRGQVANRLTMAACGLLASAAHGQNSESDWSIDVSYLSYDEKNDRISVDKIIGNAEGTLSNGDALSFDLVIDTMSGATPTGAIPLEPDQDDGGGGSPVTTTGPSGTVSGGGGRSGQGKLVRVAQFEDDRTGFNAAWQREHNRNLRMRYSVSHSSENDYVSSGVAASLEADSDDKLRTYTAGIAYTRDTISRVNSSLALPLSNTTHNQTLGEEETRTTGDLIVGLSRVVNETTLAQLNISFSQSDGYHTDPYKVISAVDEEGIEVALLNEGRPDSRQRNTLYTQLIHHTSGGHIARASYRYYVDDWGIGASTLEASYRFNLGDGPYLEPQLRLYSQNAADFYRYSVSGVAPLPQFASSDPRLADMESMTVGLKYGFNFSNGNTLRIRYDRLQQNFDNAVIDNNDASIIQISYMWVF